MSCTSALHRYSCEPMSQHSSNRHAPLGVQMWHILWLNHEQKKAPVIDTMYRIIICSFLFCVCMSVWGHMVCNYVNAQQYCMGMWQQAQIMCTLAKHTDGAHYTCRNSIGNRDNRLLNCSKENRARSMAALQQQHLCHMRQTVGSDDKRLPQPLAVVKGAGLYKQTDSKTDIMEHLQTLCTQNNEGFSEKDVTVLNKFVKMSCNRSRWMVKRLSASLDLQIRPNVSSKAVGRW